MSVTAHHLKPHQNIYVDHQVFQVVDKKEGKHGSGHSVHCTVDNFQTGHRTQLNFSHNHHVRVVEPESSKWTLTHLLDETDGKQFLFLVDAQGNTREDYSTDEDLVVNYLKKHFESSEDPLEVSLTRVFVDKLHRVDKEVTLEKVSHLQGLDLTHRYDRHHGHHHEHHDHEAHSGH